MKVYGWAVSPWMARALVCLDEAGAEYEIVPMSRCPGTIAARNTWPETHSVKSQFWKMASSRYTISASLAAHFPAGFPAFFSSRKLTRKPSTRDLFNPFGSHPAGSFQPERAQHPCRNAPNLPWLGDFPCHALDLTPPSLDRTPPPQLPRVAVLLSPPPSPSRMLGADDLPHHRPPACSAPSPSGCT